MEATIYEDCHNLIELFADAGIPQFDSFCTQWKTMMFQHIYSAQTSTLEVIQTTVVIYHMAKRSMCAKDEYGKYLSATEGKEQHNVLRRIGGLYLMYAAYFKQPTKQFIKVNVSPETWREMRSFVESLQMDSAMDGVRYIFWRLYQSDAFRFSALDYTVGLEDLVDYDKIHDDLKEIEPMETVRAKIKHKLHTIPEIRNTLKEATKLEEQYNRLKQAIAGPSSTTKSREQALPPTRIFQCINSAFDVIQNIIDETSAQKTATSNKRKAEPSTIRRELKRKAAGLIDYEDISNDDDSEDTASECTPSQQEVTETSIKKQFRFTRPAVIFNQKLPDHINKDLMDGSTSEEEEEEDNSDTVDKDNDIKEENSEKKSISAKP